MKQVSKIAPFIPFIIACLIMSISIIQVIMIPQTIDEKGRLVTYLLENSVFYGAIGLFITLNLILIKRDIWKYAFLILVLASFSPFIDLIGFFRLYFIGINIISLTILILHLYFNTEIIYNTINFFKPTEKEIQKIEQSKLKDFEQRILKFEKKFANKSEAELSNIIKENRLIPEAIEASKRLLDNKKGA
ncbi:hypothetical protein KFE94_06820 [bacterium SCSIO 12643]|nr:hypothetical protein KFE94_06820 [bacterium SCSIO 12643]